MNKILASAIALSFVLISSGDGIAASPRSAATKGPALTGVATPTDKVKNHRSALSPPAMEKRPSDGRASPLSARKAWGSNKTRQGKREQAGVVLPMF